MGNQEADSLSPGCCNCGLLCCASKETVLEGQKELDLVTISEKHDHVEDNGTANGMALTHSPQHIVPAADTDTEDGHGDVDGAHNDDDNIDGAEKDGLMDHGSGRTTGTHSRQKSPSPSNSKSFSNRAVHLKQLQSLLAYAEGVDEDWHYLKLTLKGSRIERALQKGTRSSSLRTDHRMSLQKIDEASNIQFAQSH